MHSPWAALWLSEGCGGSFHPHPHHRAGWHNQPKDKSAPATSEEKHPLYYRPQSARVSARRTTFTQDVSIVQQGEEERGTNPTDPTHGSLVLENVVVQQREAVGERGTSRDEGGTSLTSTTIPQRPAGNLWRAWTHTNSKCISLSPQPEPNPAPPSTTEIPPISQHPQKPSKHPFCKEGEQVLGGISNQNLLAGEEGGGKGNWFPVTQTLVGGEAARSLFTPLLSQQQWAPWSTCL